MRIKPWHLIFSELQLDSLFDIVNPIIFESIDSSLNEAVLLSLKLFDSVRLFPIIIYLQEVCANQFITLGFYHL